MVRTGFIATLICLTGFTTTVGQGLPVDTSYTVSSVYKKLIKNYPAIKPVTTNTLAGVQVLTDVVYRVIDPSTFGKRALHVDIFSPEAQSKNLPAVVLVHGGGWRSGNKTLNTPLALHLAQRGFVVFSVEYRLSLEAKYPAAVHDLQDCIRWIKTNAKTYKVDASRIALAGSSAGGQLVSLLGATQGTKRFAGDNEHSVSSSVQAIIDIDGLLDFTDAESLALPRTENSADVFWLEGFYEANPQKWKEASAITWVTRQSPPFLFINSSQTRFHAGHAEMVKKLTVLEVYTQTVTLEDAPHSFWFFHPWFDPMLEAITTFLTNVLVRNHQ